MCMCMCMCKQGFQRSDSFPYRNSHRPYGGRVEVPESAAHSLDARKSSRRRR
ncbi:predicted protein [Botrytis cinerea T4]|uniref:Uncharacterized protein n=1 Tax=Botryotinia fuckeliana (strain T4) TaxID=999810 RepID=G2XUY6_BOTF4|nr:predicted protein [Botrytis cinerea T4]